MTLSLLSGWAGFGESARPDPDLVAEWATHHSKRNARRHPNQPHYPGPVALPPKSEPKNVYERAKALVEEHSQWGKSRDVGKVGEGKVYIWPYNGELKLVYHRSLLKQDIIVRCAILSPATGWMWTLEPGEYDEWVRQCKAGKPSYQQEYAGGRGLLPESDSWGKRWPR